jgi:hypothetical protein
MRFIMIFLRFCSVSWLVMDLFRSSYAGRLLRGLLVLAGTAAWPLAGDHRSLEEQLSAPDAPRLTSFESTGEAEVPHRAVPAQCLGELDVGRGLGEPQVRVVGSARKQLVGLLVSRVMESPEACRELGDHVSAVEDSDGHVCHLLC